MAKQDLNLGTAANDGTGDDLRTAGTKINQNFTELYTDVASLQSISGVGTSGGFVGTGGGYPLNPPGSSGSVPLAGTTNMGATAGMGGGPYSGARPSSRFGRRVGRTPMAKKSPMRNYKKGYYGA